MLALCMETCDFVSASSLTWFGVVGQDNYETSYAAVLTPCIQGCSCRRVARCVDLLTDGMVVLFAARVTNLRCRTVARCVDLMMVGIADFCLFVDRVMDLLTDRMVDVFVTRIIDLLYKCCV